MLSGAGIVGKSGGDGGWVGGVGGVKKARTSNGSPSLSGCDLIISPSHVGWQPAILETHMSNVRDKNTQR